MSIREARELLVEVFYVSLFLSLIFMLPDLFSSDSVAVKLKEAMLTLAASMVISSPFVYTFRKSRKESEERSREIDEHNRRKGEAAERRRLYEENYQNEGKALKKLVLDDLEALAEGKNARLDPKTVDAVKALQARQGEHPDTSAAWAPLIEDLGAGLPIDPEVVHCRLNDLLYPETLEDVESLKKLMEAEFLGISRGEKPRLSPEALEASKALNEIKAREIRRRREEREAEERERRLEKEKSKRFSEAVAEIGKQSTKNILNLYGFPETSLDDLPPNEVLVRVRALREYVASLSKEEREDFENEIARASAEERKRFIRGTTKES